MTHTLQTTCPYCGVGCGIAATVDAEKRTVNIAGDQSHPANYGRLCSKGSALGETVGLEGRLVQPTVFGQETAWDEALATVARTFEETLRQYGPDAVAIYGSGQLLTEDYYVANKWMKGFIGSGNMDTNSRLCMSSSVAGHKRAFGSDTVPGCYEDLELADLIVLIGSNTAWCHPVSFQRIRTAKDANPNMKVVVIDPRHTASCDIADLHLPLASGSDAILFNGLLNYLVRPLGTGEVRQRLGNPCREYASRALSSDEKIRNTLGINAYPTDAGFIRDHTEGYEQAIAAAADAGGIEHVAAACRLDAADVRRFYDWFVETEKTMSLYSQGINQSSSGTDKVNAIINCHLATGRIGKPGMGPFSLTGQPNAMGGREVGGLSHQLAAHMDFSNPEDIDRVARFWQTGNIATKPGLPAVELFDAVYDGTVKAIWIMGTNPVVSLPNADKVKQALQRCPFVVVSDCIAGTDTGKLAHVLLPAQGWSEKDGTVTNSERRISRQRALLPPVGAAKPDWWIICQVARRMGFAEAFAFQNPVEIFREHAALSGFENNGARDFDLSALATISASEYDRLPPLQWPVNAQYPQGRTRFFDDGRFFTTSGKAQFIAIQARPPGHLPDDDYPLILNTGRLRDQWHTMTRTALAPKLNLHRPEPFVEVHPVDAERHGLTNNGLAILNSRWGSMTARVQVTDSQLPGNLFVPMHWTDCHASQGRMGAVVNPVVDPLSKQPESKHTPVRIVAHQPAWQGFLLAQRAVTVDCDYWVKINGEGYYRYELAGNELPRDWRHYAENLLQSDVQNPALGDWLEYHDQGLGNYRAALVRDGNLKTVFFVTTKMQLPERGWLGGLFSKPKLTPDERRALLTGLPPSGTPDVGAIICACFNVGEKTIRNVAEQKNLKTAKAVGDCLKAGTNCGSCIPEIKRLLVRADGNAP